MKRSTARRHSIRNWSSSSSCNANELSSFSIVNSYDMPCPRFMSVTRRRNDEKKTCWYWSLSLARSTKETSVRNILLLLKSNTNDHGTRLENIKLINYLREILLLSNIDDKIIRIICLPSENVDKTRHNYCLFSFLWLGKETVKVMCYISCHNRINSSMCSSFNCVVLLW